MNVKEVVKNVIQNYDENVEKYIQILNSIDCTLVYTNSSFKDCIYNRCVYACSIQLFKKKRVKILKSVLPIMIGSKLDVAVRKLKMTEFKTLQGISNFVDSDEFETADIAVTCFLINGNLKQIPFFITNDSTNPHIVRQSIVRLYRYDANEKGKELSYYFANVGDFKRGELMVRLNDGKYSDDVDQVFDDCPYPVDVKTFFKKIFVDGFQIDHLANRIIISPGYLFLKLFKKNLFAYLKLRNDAEEIERIFQPNGKNPIEWIFKQIDKKSIMINKSIMSGDLLHIISKKTEFYKETNFTNKMINVSSVNKTQREVGMNDEVFIEKRSTPYRDANCQYYPYIPYLSHFTNLQISSKVKTVKVLSFNNSYIGFLCLFGTSETKNIGRVMMLTKNTFVSTRDDVCKIYEFLNLKVSNDLNFASDDLNFVVVNSACIRVSEECFQSIDLGLLKEKFVYVECYRDANFIFVNYKAGLLFKHLEGNLWVTSKDIYYWIDRVYGFKTIDQIVDKKGNDFIVSYSTDIIRYFKHNAFPKNILTLNSLKNAVLAITPEYSLYFNETISAYTEITDKYRYVLEPADDISKKFALYLPKLNLMYASFKGCTQEDCIVMRSDLNVFNIYRFYTVKIKFNGSANKYFHPMMGDQNPSKSSSFLGTLSCETGKIVVASQTMHLNLVRHGERALDIYFTKPNFKIMRYKITSSYLFVSINSYHECSTGDKLCTLHGQKGVLQKHAMLPHSDSICPDIIINPYCIISRQTCGQIMEAKDSGGRDYDICFNSDGKVISGRALIAPTFYFPILYLSNEHIYMAVNCTKDKLLGQPIRGRSRQGGMRSGSMELLNGYRGNGIASCFEEIMLEHSDRIIKDDVAIPQSVVLCNEDANFFKCNIEYETEPILRTLPEIVNESPDIESPEIVNEYPEIIYEPHSPEIIYEPHSPEMKYETPSIISPDIIYEPPDIVNKSPDNISLNNVYESPDPDIVNHNTVNSVYDVYNPYEIDK